MRWVTDPDPWCHRNFAGAVRVRLAIRAELPPGAQIRFFGGEPPEIVGVVDRSDLSYSAVSEGSEPLWSPSVPGATIGLEITLPCISFGAMRRREASAWGASDEHQVDICARTIADAAATYEDEREALVT